MHTSPGRSHYPHSPTFDLVSFSCFCFPFFPTFWRACVCVCISSTSSTRHSVWQFVLSNWFIYIPFVVGFVWFVDAAMLLFLCFFVVTPPSPPSDLFPTLLPTMLGENKPHPTSCAVVDDEHRVTVTWGGVSLPSSSIVTFWQPGERIFCPRSAVDAAGAPHCELSVECLQRMVELISCKHTTSTKMSNQCAWANGNECCLQSGKNDGRLLDSIGHQQPRILSPEWQFRSIRHDKKTHLGICFPGSPAQEPGRAGASLRECQRYNKHTQHGR